ncbi:Tfp pilus assembly protein [Vibrio vulnificus]|nr:MULTISPECIES: hypothetical protein [Vibrio]ADV86332.1 hypothetical protein VVMO6_01310 [Vibrio vulnificus MO6-24/O]MCU8212458.1 Tfp pilus assembly protein [Vibrio vulnificus]MCU8234261.1 Tfp pilus assembly protein [Vibrio vulnificus]MCU8295702.1 Tfp pilus assembly protein [Vibrio vulnificus]MCU8523342.1 Tfp pilus assembly protein [Vibrio vulnificus]
MANLTFIAVSFGSSLHSFWRGTCVCSMLLRRMAFQVNVF